MSGVGPRWGKQVCGQFQDPKLAQVEHGDIATGARTQSGAFNCLTRIHIGDSIDAMSDESTRGRFLILRVVALLMGLPFVLFAFHVLRTIIGTSKYNVISIGFELGIMTPGAFCGWFALYGHNEKSRKLMLFALVGSFAVGAFGFIVGFFGPMIVSPGSNQGPLLGFFVTGPIGVFIGASIGFCIGFARIRGAVKGVPPRIDPV